jgi:uncharacterized protein YggE
MKTFLGFVLITAATAALAQPAGVMPPHMALPQTISVSGTGRSTVTPDRFSFTLGVQTVGATVDEAVSQNNQRVAAAIAALKAAGAQDKDIQTSNFNIFPQQDYQEGRLARILGYQVSNSVTVRSTKIADAGKLLGAAITNGVNTASGINFEVADPARGRDQGLRAAFDDARAKATLLAQAAGRTLGPALMISEGSQPNAPQPYPMRAMAMEAKVSQDVTVEAGSQENVYSVSVTFELR